MHVAPSLWDELKDVIDTLPKNPADLQTFIKQQIEAKKQGANPAVSAAVKSALHPATAASAPTAAADADADADAATADDSSLTASLDVTAFKPPIAYLEDGVRHELNDVIIDDLELFHAKNADATPLYTHVFSPHSTFGRIYLREFCKHYTTSIPYLQDTQRLIHRVSVADAGAKAVPVPATLDKLNETWHDIKSHHPAVFKSHYDYVEVELFDRLNNSSNFLQLLSLYSISSPLFALATPIFVMIVPFFILKFVKDIDISVDSYVEVLKDIISQHAIGKLFTADMGEVSIESKTYMVMSAIFYCFQIYQNVLACYRFYKNMFVINDHLVQINAYLHDTACRMDAVLQMTDGLETYAAFRRDVAAKLKDIREMCAALDDISPFKCSLSNVMCIGYAMKHYYMVFSNADVSAMLQYSFGFNAYTEYLHAAAGLVASGHIHGCRYAERGAETPDITTLGGDEDETKGDEDKEGDEEEEARSKASSRASSRASSKASSRASSKASSSPHTQLTNFYFPTLHGKDPVTNSVSLSKQLVITGPNAAGKTTLIKAVLFNIVLSQQIGFGYYSDACIVPYDYLHCYLNIPDTSGRDSLFQAESRRCKEILDIMRDHQQQRHFCIFDELYSGTNPYEAVASAYGYVNYISKDANVDMMLTTHYIELCKLLKRNRRIKNLCMQVNEGAQFDFEYLYKMVRGISNVKGGIKVLHDLGYPDEIIRDTMRILYPDRVKRSV